MSRRKVLKVELVNAFKLWVATQKWVAEALEVGRDDPQNLIIDFFSHLLHAIGLSILSRLGRGDLPR